MIVRWDRYATITRNEDNSGNSDSSGTNFEFDEGSGDDPGAKKVVENYPCKINENVQYDTSEKGENFKGSATMKGMFTNKLKKGDIIDNEYKIITKPEKVHGRYIQCQLVRL